MLVLFGSAVACYIAALSVRTLRRPIARLFLVIAAALMTVAWLDQTQGFDQGFRYGLGIFILMGLGVFAWLVHLPSINPQEINVGLAHAQNLHYGGATYADHFQVLTPSKPIQLEYAKKDNAHLCFGIDKGAENDGIPLASMRLRLSVKEDSGIGIRIENTQDGNPYHAWKLYRPNECFYDFENPINQRAVNTWHCLFMTFPRDGDYELKFTITADGIREITRYASVKVHASSSNT